jgi:hypothetical protein
VLKRRERLLKIAEGILQKGEFGWTSPWRKSE